MQRLSASAKTGNQNGPRIEIGVGSIKTSTKGSTTNHTTSTLMVSGRLKKNETLKCIILKQIKVTVAAKDSFFRAHMHSLCKQTPCTCSRFTILGHHRVGENSK